MCLACAGAIRAGDEGQVHADMGGVQQAQAAASGMRPLIALSATEVCHKLGCTGLMGTCRWVLSEGQDAGAACVHLKMQCSLALHPGFNVHYTILHHRAMP